MFALVYTITDLFAEHFTLYISMGISAYTWSIGAFSSIPYYALIDFALALLTLLHIIVAFSFLAVYDASYKKTMLELHYSIVKPLSNSALFLPVMNAFALVVVAYLCRSAYNNAEDSKATLRALIAVNTWACSIFLQKMSNILVKMGVDYAVKIEQDVEKHDIKSWTTPPKWTALLFAPFNWFFRAQVFGVENIHADRPGLYVMNHALMGMEMGPFVATMFTVGNVFLRGLSDLFHFGQLHGEFIRYFGGVAGTRDNVDVLMENGDNILVYPGGGHEIMKPSTVPRYTLMWKQRLGFARMAIKHGYPIVPCCSVGTEDMFQTVYDLDLGFIRKGQKLPISILRLDRLQKVYFWVGEPIPTDQYNGDFHNTEFAQEIRDQTKAAVEAGIREMQERQANDPDRYLFDYIGNTAKRMAGKIFGASSTSTKYVEEAVPGSKKID